MVKWLETVEQLKVIETVEWLDVVSQLEVVKWFYAMMGHISIVFIEVIFAINPLLKVYCLVPLISGHTLHKKFITVRARVHQTPRHTRPSM